MVVSRKFFVSGIVQGVGFRYFTLRSAAAHQVTGLVRNLPDGRVEVIANGPESSIEAFRQDLSAGPTYSRVDKVEEIVIEADREYRAFRIDD
ncbi:MAG TPA: acylphosphatase [Pyrinomonadaceae bacterium]|nr:acylphosphatase [Pyrinomonadaceae bacterium]